MKSLELTTEQQGHIYIASGSTHPELAEETAACMGLTVGAMERRQFPNTEQYVRYGESVRGDHVFVMQALAAADGRSVNDSLMELMLMVDAAKRASAAEITVVAPYMAYSRQDRKARGREPISAAATIRILQSAGADRLVSVDMHSPQTQATFNGPFDHLTAEPLLRKALKSRIKADPEASFLVVSPDGGRAKVAEHYAHKLKVAVAHMPKSRDRHNPGTISRPENMLGVDGKICILVDDMIDTAGTLISAAEALKRSGAAMVIACATHGLFSAGASERLAAAPVDEIIVADTVPVNAAKQVLGEKLRVVRSAPLLARALGEIATHGSVSKIFNDRNNQ